MLQIITPIFFIIFWPNPSSYNFFSKKVLCKKFVTIYKKLLYKFFLKKIIEKSYNLTNLVNRAKMCLCFIFYIIIFWIIWHNWRRWEKEHLHLLVKRHKQKNKPTNQSTSIFLFFWNDFIFLISLTCEISHRQPFINEKKLINLLNIMFLFLAQEL